MWRERGERRMDKGGEGVNGKGERGREKGERG